MKAIILAVTLALGQPDSTLSVQDTTVIHASQKAKPTPKKKWHRKKKNECQPSVALEALKVFGGIVITAVTILTTQK